jgi:quinol monooxygenase YgiN
MIEERDDWPMIGRRMLLGSTAALLVSGCATRGFVMGATGNGYGLIGQMKSLPGKRSELLGYLTEGSNAMPGNRLYLVAEDASDPDSIWVTEVWDSKEAHTASLRLPAVQAAIAKAKPILAGFGTSAEIRPVSGL